MSRFTASLSQFGLVALWLGAAVFFTVAVAPAVFAVLPTRTLAGLVVGRLLPAIFYSGIVIGLAAAVLETMARGGWDWRGRDVAAGVMAAACAVAQFVIAPRIERVRAEIAGPLERLPVDDVRRVTFGRLHGISVGWLGIAMIAAAVIVIAAGRTMRARD